VRDADRSIRVERGLEAHGRRGFVALDADKVEDVDRGAVSCVADAVTAVIGSHQTNAGLVI
jgi:hypothetical protein